MVLLLGRLARCLFIAEPVKQKGCKHLLAPPPQDLKAGPPEQPDPPEFELVSVTEDDLPAVETPTSPNVSPLDGLSVDSQSQTLPADPEDARPPAAPGPGMPVIKVQPFIRGEVTCLPSANHKRPDRTLAAEIKRKVFAEILPSAPAEEDHVVKSWKSRVVSHRRHLLVALGIALALALVLGVGLGGQFPPDTAQRSKLIFRKVQPGFDLTRNCISSFVRTFTDIRSVCQEESQSSALG